MVSKDRMQQLSERFPHRGPGSLFGDQSSAGRREGSRCFCSKRSRQTGRMSRVAKVPNVEAQDRRGRSKAPLPV